MRYPARIVTFGLVLLAAACDAPTAAPDLAPPEAELQDLQVVARSMAMGMKDPAARLAVRDALRDSPWSEHKVVFQELLRSDAGGPLLEAAARAGGESVEAFRDRVSRLPELDFYVPSREQRISWRGTPDVAVAATLDLDAAQVAGFTSNGRGVADALTLPADAVLLLAPRELRTLRLDPQPVGVGETIQSRDESEETETLFSWSVPGGEEITVPHQELVQERESRLSPLMNHSSNSSTLVEQIAGYMQDGSSNYLELGVAATFYAHDGSVVATATWKKTNIPRNTLVTIGETLFPSHVIPDSGVAYIRATLWELDNCGNFDHYSCGTKDDDPYGSTNYYWNDRDAVKSISCPSGSSVCSYNALTGNLKLHWHARSPSVFSGVSVIAQDINVGDYGSASARAVDQYGYNLSGYSVSSWSISDTNVASLVSTSGSSATYYGSSAGGTYISATINGVTASDYFTVSEVYEPCDPSRPWEIC